jgi:[ribosomal protein S5]-alanine N-acetyltransferase
MDHATTTPSKLQKKAQIQGYRIQLVKVSFEHVQAIYNLIKTPSVLDYLTLKEPTNTEEIRQYIIFLQNQWLMNQDFTFTIELLPSGDSNNGLVPIGQISLYDINFIHKRAEIGIWLGSPYWKNGYASEALKLLIRYAFEDLQINRLQAHIFLENIPSQNLFERIGFQREGINRDYVIKETSFQDVYAYSLLRKDWAENNR